MHHRTRLPQRMPHERITPWKSSVLAQLLRLPPGDRAELAMALWESLSDDEREGEVALSPEQRAELDRRWGRPREETRQRGPLVRSSPEVVGKRVTRRVVFRPEAEDEVLETRRRYEERREGLGAEFASAVDAIVERIVTGPLAFPLRSWRNSASRVAAFPYAISAVQIS